MGLSQGSISMGQPGMGQQLGPIGGPIGGPSQAGSFPQLGVAVKCLKPPRGRHEFGVFLFRCG